MKNEELDNIIEKSFREEPEFKLPADFALKVTKLVVGREQWKTDLHEYLYITAALMGLILISFGLYYYIDKSFVTRIITFVSQNYVQVLFIGFLLNFIFFVDKVLLRMLFIRRKLL